MTLPSNSTYDEATVLNPSSAVTDFVLFIDLSRMSAAWWAAAENTNKRRGRAAKGDGTELACDWLLYDHSGQTGFLRVLWSGSLAASGTQTLRIYPPQARNSIYLDTDTYGPDNAYSSDCVAYWTLYDNDIVDRTGNGWDLTADVALTLGGVTGKIGPATDLNDLGAMYSPSAALNYSTGQFTTMAWAESEIGETSSPWRGILSRNHGNGDIFLGERGISDDITARGLAGSTEHRATSSTITPGTPKHFAGGNDGSNLFVYENGVSQGSTAAIPTAGSSTAAFEIGDSEVVPGNYWEGTIEQVWHYGVGLSGAFIEHEYDQTNDQAAFWGTWTNVAAPSSGPVDDNYSDCLKRLVFMTKRN